MPDLPTDADATAEPAFEDLLVDLLQAMERQGDTAIETLCAAHPDHAARLRAHARRLADLGLLAAAQAGPDLAGLPERLGDYRLLHRIGSGGMGMVYAAEQTSLGRRVALKLIRPEQLYSTSARERFAREVHAVAKLQHPGIVPVHDAGETAGLPWLAMELVDGAPLDQVLEALRDRAPDRLTGHDLEQAVLRITAARRAASGTVDAATSALRPSVFTGTWVAACLRLARAVADALVHAHERGVLHRDVKPSNVMLTPDGRAQLLDFGLALSDGSARLTQGQLGSPAYMSPEQVRGEELDARTDVWSLGVTLCELLTSRSPYAADTAERTRTAVLEARPPRLREHNPAVPRDTELVCLTAIGAARGDRYATMRAFAADLDNLLERRPVQARPPGPWLVLRRWAQRRPASATAVVAAVLLLVVAPTVFWLQQRSANDAIRRQRDHARAAVQTLLSRVGSEDLREMPHMQDLRRDLLTQARDFHARFLAEAGDDPELLGEAVESATELARVDVELGMAAQARGEAERAVALARRLHARQGGSRETLPLLASAVNMLGGILVQLGERTAGRAAVGEAITLQRQLVAQQPGDHEAVARLVEYLRIAATTDLFLGRLDEVLAVHAEIRALRARLEATADLSPRMRELALAAIADEAFVHVQCGDAAAAEAAVDELLDWSAQLAPGSLSSIERVAIARCHDLFARLRQKVGDLGGAEAAARRAIAEAETLLTELPQHANALATRASALNTLGFTLRSLPDRRAEARSQFADAVATLRRLVAIDPDAVSARGNLATSIGNLGSMAFEDGDHAGAEPLFREAAQLVDEVCADAPDDARWPMVAADLWNYVGRVADERRDHATAATAAERVAAARPDDAHTQRIAGMLLAGACRHLRADAELPAGEREARLGTWRSRCLAQLQRAAELGCTDHEFLAGNDWFAEVRGEPGFGAIVDRMRRNAAAETK